MLCRYLGSERTGKEEQLLLLLSLGLDQAVLILSICLCAALFLTPRRLPPSLSVPGISTRACEHRKEQA